MSATPDNNASIMDRRELHDGLFFVWLSPDGGEYAPFIPGQFVSIGRRIVSDDGTATLVKRTYSIGSSAHKRESVELFVVHVDDGEFTSWLGTQPVGTRLWLSPRASGGFTLDGFIRDRDLVLVATGTGVAPYLSMYRTYRDNPPWRRLVLINGVRNAADLGYRKELEAEEARDQNFIYIPTITRDAADSGWAGHRGRVDAILDPDTYRGIVGAELDPSDCHVFLCGNPDMVDGLEASLTARGFRKHTTGHPGNLHLERYW